MNVQHLIELTEASALACIAAFAFYPAQRLANRSRASVWLACSAIVALSPCLIPTDAKPLRMLGSLLSIGLLVKLYDVHIESRLGRPLALNSYLAYMPDFFWLVRRREPGRRLMPNELKRLALLGPAALLSVIPCIILFQIDWSDVPVAVEHVLKVPAVVLAVILISNATSSIYRLLGGVAIEPMGNPFAAPTPADFWWRWNRPAQQFFGEYAFKPAGGFRRLIRATLVAFVVSGLIHEYVFGFASGRVQCWQILFFSIQGCAVAASMNRRIIGRTKLVWIVGTWLLNLATSWLFFRSVDDLLPFYARCDR